MFRSFTLQGGKLENCGFFTGLLIAHRGPTLGLHCDIKKASNPHEKILLCTISGTQGVLKTSHFLSNSSVSLKNSIKRTDQAIPRRTDMVLC